MELTAFTRYEVDKIDLQAFSGPFKIINYRSYITYLEWSKIFSTCTYFKTKHTLRERDNRVMELTC